MTPVRIIVISKIIQTLKHEQKRYMHFVYDMRLRRSRTEVLETHESAVQEVISLFRYSKVLMYVSVLGIVVGKYANQLSKSSWTT